MSHPDPQIQTLINLDPIKTWSLIATLLGDVQKGALSGKEITAFLAPVGIKPEAQRVALHRLKKDGWILSERTGREVIYQLSPAARAETEAAYGDVYSQTPKFPGGWHALLLPDDAAAPQHAILLSKSLYLAPVAAPFPAAALPLSMNSAAPPDWIENRLILPETRARARSLTALCQTLAPSNTTRLLCLHHWRKIALRPESWAHVALFPQGNLAACHSVLTKHLATWPKLSLE